MLSEVHCPVSARLLICGEKKCQNGKPAKKEGENAIRWNVNLMGIYLCSFVVVYHKRNVTVSFRIPVIPINPTSQPVKYKEKVVLPSCDSYEDNWRAYPEGCWTPGRQAYHEPKKWFVIQSCLGLYRPGGRGLLDMRLRFWMAIDRCGFKRQPESYPDIRLEVPRRE